MLLSKGDSGMSLVRVAARSELPACGKVKEFMASGKMLCIANIDGEIHAMDNGCLHRGGPLGKGAIENGKVVCPWHGWRFDPKTGQGPPKASRRLKVYTVRTEGEEVFIEL